MAKVDMSRANALTALMNKYHLSKPEVVRLLSFGDKNPTINNVEGWLSIGQTRPMPLHNLYILKLCGKLYDLTGKWPG